MISFIIPAYNEEQLLSRTLTALQCSGPGMVSRSRSWSLRCFH